MDWRRYSVWAVHPGVISQHLGFARDLREVHELIRAWKKMLELDGLDDLLQEVYFSWEEVDLRELAELNGLTWENKFPSQVEEELANLFTSL